MPIGIGTGLLISGAVGAGTSAYAAHKGSKSAKEAGAIQSHAADAALAFEREQEARRQKEYDEERARGWSLEDQDRQLLLADRARRQELQRPYGELGGASARSLMALMQARPDVNFRIPDRPAAPPTGPMIPSGPARPLPSAPPPGMPSLVPQQMPPGMLQAATLADLARGRPTQA